MHKSKNHLYLLIYLISERLYLDKIIKWESVILRHVLPILRLSLDVVHYILVSIECL